MPEVPRKLILLALDVYDQRFHRGVIRYAARRGWRLQLVSPLSWKHHLRLRPDGVISLMEPVVDDERPPVVRTQTPHGETPEATMEGGMSGHIVDLGVPIVDIGLHRPEVAAVRLPPDNLAAGRLAARHLLERGGGNFLFVANEPSRQDEERLAGFRAGLAGAGHTCGVLHLRSAGITTDERMLDALALHPKPLSVFCSFDIWASMVLAACELGGLRVPEDVAILGCYNHELISAFAGTGISSIDMNIETRGYMAAEALDRLMRGEIAPGDIIRTPVAGVVGRASTGSTANLPPTLAFALMHIRENCGGPLAVDELARAAGVSRTSLQRTCHAHFGHGIGEEIIRARVEKACGLLTTTRLTASMIADELGYSSPFRFYRAFKKVTGMTTGRYRRLMRPGFDDRGSPLAGATDEPSAPPSRVSGKRIRPESPAPEASAGSEKIRTGSKTIRGKS